MVSLDTARALQAAGLAWQPAPLDFFAIPDSGLDDRVFVLSDLPAGIVTVQGRALVTFDGAVEWALDYVPAGEVVWLPREAQLRALLAERLPAAPDDAITLQAWPGRCRCQVRFRGQALSFEAPTAAEAYAAALLHVLRGVPA